MCAGCYIALYKRLNVPMSLRNSSPYRPNNQTKFCRSGGSFDPVHFNQPSCYIGRCINALFARPSLSLFNNLRRKKLELINHPLIFVSVTWVGISLQKRFFERLISDGTIPFDKVIKVTL